MQNSERNRRLPAERVTRAPWSAPAVKRLNAGAAENASGPTHDDPIDYS